MTTKSTVKAGPEQVKAESKRSAAKHPSKPAKDWGATSKKTQLAPNSPASAPKKPAQKRKKPEDDPLLTAAEYARSRKKTRQAVSRMVKRHGIYLDENKKAKRSVWLAADAIGRTQDKNTLKARAKGVPDGGLAAVGMKSKIKKMDLDIELAEHELAKIKGELISRQEAERQMADTVSLCLTLIDQVADNWAAIHRDAEGYGELVAGIDRARSTIVERELEL